MNLSKLYKKDHIEKRNDNKENLQMKVMKETHEKLECGEIVSTVYEIIKFLTN